ncbi:MAG: tetratricopeptide repeat protein [Deltaproteobacteria bacterium]|nr:tetratricopeptide repeat protein [Deltaproteobacteria bacterium]
MTVLDEAEELSVRHFGDRHPETAGIIYHKAEAHRVAGSYETAERMARQAILMQSQLLGEQHPEVAASLLVLASIRLLHDDTQEAEAFSRRALGILRARRSESDLMVIAAMMLLARVCWLRGNPKETEELIRRVLKNKPPTLEAAGVDFFEAVQLLVVVLVDTRRFEEAARVCLDLLSLLRTTCSEDDPALVPCLEIFANVRLEMQELEDAKLLLERAIAIRRISGERDAGLGNALDTLAVVEEKAGHAEVAEEYRSAARAIARQLGIEC